MSHQATKKNKNLRASTVIVRVNFYKIIKVQMKTNNLSTNKKNYCVSRFVDVLQEEEDELEVVIDLCNFKCFH